ncbi:thioester domain-containing protein [Nocardiopsis alkaliphila]|uniref:thioester domain-containing protein n=1 Tax=Nocardiopsis alkaliphila TaxID=225762 RepID=UPI0003491169|nr:thioester domain-containing protein [Nocardiopsis alkaliphila]
MSGTLRRCVALLCATALIGTLSASPSLAEDFSRVDRDPVSGMPVMITDGVEADTALFSLRVADQGSVRAYATVLDEQVRPRTAYVESAWAEHPEWSDGTSSTDPADRANWIVRNSYPNRPLDTVASAAGLTRLEEHTAIAATQAALWHVLDGVDPDPEANDGDVLHLFEHLVQGSSTARDGTTARSLEVSPSHLEAVAPTEPLGPLTVSNSGGEPVRVSVRGAPASWLVDGEGREVSLVEDGGPIYLNVDPSVPSGVATLHVRGSDVPLEEGRLFIGREGVRTQPLITAEPGTATSFTTATFTWHAEEPSEATVDDHPPPVEPQSPSPHEETHAGTPEATAQATEGGDRNSEDGLAFTGTWVSGLLVIAGALVVSGLLILVLGRKRRD